MKIKIHYEARLNRNITRTLYNKKVYKKGTVVCDFTESTFKKLTAKNIDRYTDLGICEGHGTNEYFDLETDIEFFKVEKIIKIKQTKVKLKK